MMEPMAARVTWRRADGSVWSGHDFSAPGARAARSLLTDAGLSLAVTEIDSHHWAIAAPSGDWRFTLWPETGFWRHPDGDPGGAGVPGLINGIRRWISGLAIAHEGAA